MKLNKRETEVLKLIKENGIVSEYHEIILNGRTRFGGLTSYKIRKQLLSLQDKNLVKINNGKASLL